MAHQAGQQPSRSAVIKDWLAMLASVVTAASFLFAAYQFYLGRKAIQSQAVRDAYRSVLSIHEQASKQPDLFADIYEVQDKDRFVENLVIRRMLAFYSSLHYDKQADLLPPDAWPAIHAELCVFVNLPRVEPIVAHALEADQYPQTFEKVLAGCKGGP